MENQERLYIQGFNSGYLLAKHKPDLASKLATHLSPEDDFSGGLISGKQEYELERIREHEKELSEIRTKSVERNRDLER